MTLKTLTIRHIERWEGVNAGQFEARMQWEDDGGQSVSVVLAPEVSKALLAFCAPLLTKFAAEGARKIEAAALLAIADSEKATLPLEDTAS